MSAAPQGSIYLVAGEPSGDLQGALLARELKNLKPDISLAGMGGPLMQAQGVRLSLDITHLAVVGFFEVLRNLGTFIRTLRKVLADIEVCRPRAVVLIDYPGFNLRLAAHLKKRKIPVIYYISPQVWAWKAGRVKKIARRVDKMICLFDFEVPLYEKEGLCARWVGHPFVDVVRPRWSLPEALEKLNLKKDVPTIGILPGSREQEIERHLPLLLGAAQRIQKEIGPCQFPVSCVPSLDPKLFSKHLTSNHSLKAPLVRGNFFDLVHCCDLVLTSSGSATLMTAILEKPMIVIYRVGGFTAMLARCLVRIPHIALVNVVAGEKIVPELLQEMATPETIAHEAQALLKNPKRLDQTRQSLRKVRNRLGAPGAARRAAQEVLKSL